MFKMLEIIGNSANSFSEAVKKAIEQVINSGETVHFFEVIEQRGAVRQNTFKEFQVKLKVAVEIEKSKISKEKISDEKSPNICPTCLQTTGKEGHMCVPVTKEDKKCDWCGSLIVNERHLCEDKIKEIAYVCNSCGRTAVKEEHLCHPLRLKK